MRETWTPPNERFSSRPPYSRANGTPCAVAYIVANLALALHLSHGAASLFQSMGWVNHRRRQFALAFAVVIALGNISFPIAVLTGVIS